MLSSSSAAHAINLLIILLIAAHATITLPTYLGGDGHGGGGEKPAHRGVREAMTSASIDQ
jgi:hypothetical protein